LTSADFASLDTLSPSYLLPARGGKLASPANTTYSTGNTTSLNGYVWADAGSWIGAYALPKPPSANSRFRFGFGFGF
jgi:hypothetical protein